MALKMKSITIFEICIWAIRGSFCRNFAYVNVVSHSKKVLLKQLTKRLNLTKEKLNKIIESLESSNLIDDAYLAIYQHGGGPDESFAKANKEGLELFAVELLKASRDFDEIVNDNEKNVIPFDYKGNWIEGDIFIQYVEPVDKEGKLIREEEPYTETFFDRFIPFGCIGGIILMVIFAIVGLVSILKWIFT